jgi:predicted nucleic acid-binding protein
MRNKAYDLVAYNFSRDEPLLFDTNVWLYLFPAPSDKLPYYATRYSSALKRMLAAGVHLALDAMVLSEYLNRYCRIEWEARFRVVHPKFKPFRTSPDFAPVGQNATAYARRILKLCSRHDHPFEAANVNQVLTDFGGGLQDFNDGLLADICRQRGWKLVTNDGDFTEGGIEVLTANHRLLQACK